MTYKNPVIKYQIVSMQRAGGIGQVLPLFQAGQEVPDTYQLLRRFVVLDAKPMYIVRFESGGMPSSFAHHSADFA